MALAFQLQGAGYTPTVLNTEAALMGRGFHRSGDVEKRLGYHVGQLGG